MSKEINMFHGYHVLMYLDNYLIIMHGLEKQFICT